MLDLGLANRKPDRPQQMLTKIHLSITPAHGVLVDLQAGAHSAASPAVLELELEGQGLNTIKTRITSTIKTSAAPTTFARLSSA